MHGIAKFLLFLSLCLVAVSATPSVDFDEEHPLGVFVTIITESAWLELERSSGLAQFAKDINEIDEPTDDQLQQLGNYVVKMATSGEAQPTIIELFDQLHVVFPSSCLLEADPTSTHQAICKFEDDCLCVYDYTCDCVVPDEDVAPIITEDAVENEDEGIIDDYQEDADSEDILDIYQEPIEEEEAPEEYEEYIDDSVDEE
jgi:hypothetical protein